MGVVGINKVGSTRLMEDITNTSRVVAGVGRGTRSSLVQTFPGDWEQYKVAGKYVVSLNKEREKGFSSLGSGEGNLWIGRAI